MSTNIRTALALSALAAVLAGAGACGKDEPKPTAPAVTPTEVTTTVLIPTPTTVTSGIPTNSPLTDEARKTALFKALTDLDSTLVATEDEAWEKGEKTCEAVEANPTDQDGLVGAAEKNFAKATDTDGINPAQALSILDAVRTYVCPEE